MMQSKKKQVQHLFWKKASGNAYSDPALGVSRYFCAYYSSWLIFSHLTKPAAYGCVQHALCRQSIYRFNIFLILNGVFFFSNPVSTICLRTNFFQVILPGVFQKRKKYLLSMLGLKQD